MTAGVKGGRIVILTLHPPTYEIFTMLSRVALLSAGRLMFSGRRRDMLPYFAMVDYPCPAYKNPSDYYRESYLKYYCLYPSVCLSPDVTD